MSLFNNKRKDYSIRPPRQQVNTTPFFVTDSANIDFTLSNLNLTADLTFTGVVAGTYGDATHIPILQIDQWGRVTGVTLTTFSASGILLETNSTANASQTILNLTNGTDISIQDLGGGNIQISYTGTGGTYTADNGLTPEFINPNNFQLGGSLIKSTVITSQQFNAADNLRFDAPSALINTVGAFQFTAITAVARSSTSVLASFRANDCITAYFETGIILGSSSTAVKIKSINTLSVPLLIEGSLGSNLLKVLDSGQLELAQYNTSTSFQGSSGPSQGILNVDSTGKVFVTTAPSGTSPLTTKGDIYVRNATIDTRLPVGLDTQVLLADSTQSTGLRWGTNTAPTPLGYYGAFSDYTNQTAALVNTGYPMILGTTDLTNGVTIVSTTRVTIANTGIYNIQWSAQFRNPTAAEHDVTIWLRKNGVDIPGSAGIVSVPKKHGSLDGHVLPSWNFLIDPIGGDYYEFVWSTTDTNVYISFNPAASPSPSTASVVLTVTQQSGIMAGTGITALNGLTASVQTFATPGTTGTAPNWNSATSTHTLNIPLASAAGVTAGLISKADYDVFSGKQSALSGTGIVKSSSGTISYINGTTSQYVRGDGSLQTFPSVVAPATVFFGDGFDGAITLNGTNTYSSIMSLAGSTYTLLRSIYPSSITVNNGITLLTNGYQVTCNGTMTVNGTVGSIGNAGGNAVTVFNNYSTAGTGGASLKPNTNVTDQILVGPSSGGGNGSNGVPNGWGSAGGSISVTWYYYAALGGGGGRGWVSLTTQGAASTVTVGSGGKFLPHPTFNTGLSNHIGWLTVNVVNFGGILVGSGGGGGGGAGTQLGGGWGGAGGGGGGGPLGVKILANALTVSATGLIVSNGGNGGNGCPGSLSNWAHGAGGGGGNGGIVYIVTNTLTYTPNNQIQAKGGIGGLGGVGVGAASGLVSTPGSNGADGYVHIMNTSTGLSTFYTGQY